jgi:ATP-dependent DNA helicase RecQ
MILATFDLYWKIDTDNHWINIYYQLFFDDKKLNFSKKEENQINKNKLVNILNKVDYRACHNFFWYDWEKLPLLKSHTEKNIDTLLIDTLFYFEKSHHNLQKSFHNNPLEDAQNTFKVLEKNFLYFHNLEKNLKNIIYSLLLKYDEYNDFFIFYNKLTNNKLEYLTNNQIIEQLNLFIFEKWFLKDDFNFHKYLKNNNSRLALVYLILFLEKQKIVLPDFLFKENLELKSILKELLDEFYKNFSQYFNNNIKKILKEYYWFNDFRWKIQKNWVKYSLENKDILAILWTGWGKSLIYQLPARIIWENLGALTLVITPLKALIKDQIDWLQNKWFNEVEFFSADQSNLEKQIIREKIKSWDTKLLFLTPESLRSEKNFEFLKNRFISRIVIDEAHTLILWWAEFRPDYFFIKTFLEDLEKENLNRKINITLLTATAPIDVENWLKKYFNNRIFEIIKQENTLKDNIKPSVINIDNKENKTEILIQKIKEINIEKNPTIIFVWERKTAENLVKILHEEGIKTEFFHAWMKLKDKKIIQEDFISWKLNLIIATKAFWMWIDKENVRYVIHYDLPWNIEDYLQEIWRAW